MHARADIGRALRRAAAQHGAGNLAAAGEIYRRVIETDPGNAEALHASGVIAHQVSQHDAAIDLLRLAISIDPQANYFNTLGSTWDALGRTEAAIASYRQALARDAACVNAWCNLGNALRKTGAVEEAQRCYEAALDLNRDDVLTHYNFGGLLSDLRRFDEAEAMLARALALQPGFPQAWFSLGNIARERGDHARAIERHRRALALDPTYHEPHLGIGDALAAQGQSAEAEACYRRAIELQPACFEAHNNLANALKDQGRTGEAVHHYREAILARPGELLPYSNFLYAMNYFTGATPEAIAHAHREVVAPFEAAVQSARRAHDNASDPHRRLKLGYVSADFRSHVVSLFIEPVLAAHDRGAFEVFGYHNSRVVDDVTRRLQGYFDHFANVAGLDDDTLAARIRNDGIDVLVDLSGHSAGNRLMVFARKPAPVQITWLGYPATTGLQAMDYRITDAHADPEGESEPLFSERLVRMPHSTWCYRPPHYAPPVAPLPARTCGHVTFGSFNNVAKINPEVLAVWAEVLHAVPSSRLLLVTVPHGAARERIRAALIGAGIEPGRIDFRGRLSANEFQATHHEVDIALDPFPVNGGATTCETLWMGVPVITLSGNTFVGRAGASLLAAAGLRDLIAANAGEYAAIAARLGADIEGLATLRAGLRGRMIASPLCRADEFARALEGNYREMWQRWCGGAN